MISEEPRALRLDGEVQHVAAVEARWRELESEVTSLDAPVDLPTVRRAFELARQAVKEDGADVIVFGGAPLSGLAGQVRCLAGYRGKGD